MTRTRRTFTPEFKLQMVRLFERRRIGRIMKAKRLVSSYTTLKYRPHPVQSNEGNIKIDSVEIVLDRHRWSYSSVI